MGDLVSAVRAIYGLLNDRFFEGALARPGIEVGRVGATGHGGAFRPGRWHGGARVRPVMVVEPAIPGPRAIGVLAALIAHQMVHQWQHEIDHSASRAGYHNQRWAWRMRSLGLRPTKVGRPGVQTGDAVQQDIHEGGRFDSFVREIGTREDLAWVALPGPAKLPREPGGRASGRRRDRIGYECRCGQKVWGKPGLALCCGGNCRSPFSALPAVDERKERREE